MNHFNKILITSLVLVWLSCNTIGGFAQTDVPGWNLKTGDAFSVELTQTSKSETNVDARETTIDNLTVLEMDWLVTDVAENGDATIEQSLTRIKLSVTGFTRKKKGDPASPLKDIAFDTSAPDDISKDSATLLGQIQPLIGLKFAVVMSPQGEIKDVTVTEEVAAQLEEMPDTSKLRQLFAKEGWKEVLGASAMILPDGLVPGKEWTDESEAKTAFGVFNRKRNYKYVGKKEVDGQQLAEFVLDVSLDSVAPVTPSDSLKSKLIEFTGSGRLLMDVEGGFLKSSKVQNRAHSEKPYREKNIATVVTNEIETSVTKK